MTFYCLLALLSAHAQAPNDNIENRRPLRAEETITSNTTGCTVQRTCVDERLTGKCIDYHNDQWFEFTPTVSGTYYANIGGQYCRDVRGVQLVVLTGTPCQPATYRILSCTSFGTQDDIFVALPDLKAGVPYLLDVDGYLKDYCGFTLQVSGLARGLPAGPLAPVPASAPGMSRVVQVAWQVPDSLNSVTYCRVLRREEHASRATEIHWQVLAHNTYGQRQAAYTVTDTLPAVGRYLYQVVAEGGPTPPVVVLRQWSSYSKLRPVVPGAVATDVAHLDLPLSHYPNGASLDVVITDPSSGHLLRTGQLTNDLKQPKQGRLYTQPWLDTGLRQVAVDITCRPRRGRAYTDHLLLPLAAALP